MTVISLNLIEFADLTWWNAKLGDGTEFFEDDTSVFSIPVNFASRVTLVPLL